MKTVMALLIILGSTALLPAQQPNKPLDPPELVQTKADHVRTMYRAQIAPLTNYVQALTGLRALYVRENKADAVAAVDAAIKSAQTELDAANAGSNLTVSAATQLQIEQAVFGDVLRNRVFDVTNYVKNALASGVATVSIYGKDMIQGDPAPGIHKTVRIIYTVDGKRKSKDFKEGPDAVLDFKKDLR